MLLVRTRLRPSPIEGLGCFTEQPIEKGQVVWQFDPRIDLRIPLRDLASFPPAVQDYLRTYTYIEIRDGEEVMVLCADNAKHVNHSDHPNLLDTPDGLQEIAARDIREGEELTCNYYINDISAREKLSLSDTLTSEPPPCP